MERAYSLTDEEFQIVLAGIAKLPFEITVQVWNKLQTQRQAMAQEDLAAAQQAHNSAEPPHPAKAVRASEKVNA